MFGIGGCNQSMNYAFRRPENRGVLLHVEGVQLVVDAFSRLSMDVNPLHVNFGYAKKSMFGRRIMHGFLTASLFSIIIGTKFSGEESIYMNQNISFLHPVFYNQLVTATVTVKELFPEKRGATRHGLPDETDLVLITGTALVKLEV